MTEQPDGDLGAAPEAIVNFTNGQSASFDGVRWTGPDQAYNAFLNLVYNQAELRALNTLAYYPNWTWAVADWAAKEVGGTVENEPPPDEPGLIY